ncbi:Transposase DDE domain protein [Bacteroidales bacterium Barb6]|nr:Transposase DDE domain protein [Bacteroidales bacterium Barb6]
MSYNRFAELEKKAALPVTCLSGDCTGIPFADSACLKVCRNQRIHNHKVFKNIAGWEKSSVDRFFGFKLHLTGNEKGAIINFVFAAGNADDRASLKSGSLLKGVAGKLFADKGYIAEGLFNRLCLAGIHLLTAAKRNMKERYITLNGQSIFRKRAVFESGNNNLKNICQIEHARHRIFNNFIADLISGIVAYCFYLKSYPFMSSLNGLRNTLYSILISNSMQIC